MISSILAFYDVLFTRLKQKLRETTLLFLKRERIKPQIYNEKSLHISEVRRWKQYVLFTNHRFITPQGTAWLPQVLLRGRNSPQKSDYIPVENTLIFVFKPLGFAFLCLAAFFLLLAIK